MIIALGIAFSGIMIVREAIRNIFTSSSYEFTYLLPMSLLFSMIAKYWLFRYLKRNGDEMGSTALEDSSKDAKVDVLSSLSALGGVLGELIGAPILDTVLGVVVSIWIFKTAHEIMKENIGFLTGTSAPKETIEEIKNILEKRKEIKDYHDLIAHHVGPEIHVS